MADEVKEQTTGEGAGGGWYRSGESDAPLGAEVGRSDTAQGPDRVTWTASEFIAHEKGVGWYGLLALAAILVAAVLYWIIRDIFSIVVVLIMAAILGITASRRPRVLSYKLDNAGLTVGSKFYPYYAYKSFSIPEMGPFVSIELTPLKRLALPVSLYLAPDSQDKVLDILSNHLPMERRELSTIDHLMHQLRF